MAVHRRTPLEVLQEYWGYSSFREPQAAVISNALAGNDSLVVMATGGGKSLCYQVPPLVSGAPCIVVSPLIALMEDQVAALTARGIKAAMLGSAQTKTEIKRAAWAGEYDLVYITPELATNNTGALQQLHANRPLGLIAIDEAHCLSEWGHDFRPSYRRLGELREALPGVPIMAVTATATDRVQKDIISQLHMNQRGSPAFRQWVMSFQRPNLHLSVRLKAAGGAATNLAGLIAEAAGGESSGATLIYAQTTNEVDMLAAHLQAKGVRAVKYHAKLPVSERMAAHRDFQRDDASVMVASLAFGMGIDKPNIRRIIHYGIPSSLESYYQQAGRAGRDGLKAECCLLWSPQDFNVQDIIKGASGLTGWNLESHTRGMEALRAYTSSGTCRHAALVNFFKPDALSPDGPCEGGCDNCDRRRSAAPGTELGTDVTQQARLLVAAVKGLKKFGLGRAVDILRGSKKKDVQPWMHQLTGPDGKQLHGAGSNRSESWWKGLGGVLMGQGFLASKSVTNGQGSSYSITIATPKGCQWLSNANPAPLRLMLPTHMEVEESRQQRKEAAEAQRAAERQAAQQKRGEEAAEKQRLLLALREARKVKADALGQAPDVLVNDATLQLLVELRPSDLRDLESVSGFGTAATQHFGEPLLRVIRDFCASSIHLKHNTDWVQVKRVRCATLAGQQQQLQQQLQQYRMMSQPGQGGSQPGQGVSHHGVNEAGLGGVTSQAALPGAVGALAGAAAAAEFAATQYTTQPGLWIHSGTQHAGPLQPDSAPTQQQQQHQPQVPSLTADPEQYQGLLDAKVLSEPKKAAMSAWDQWESGQTVQQIAENRDKPIQESTVLGYLAEAAAAYGCSLEKAQQLQASAGLAGSAAADVLLWRIVAGITGSKGCSLSYLKNNLPSDISYGQIKLVAALLALGAIPGTAVGSDDQLEPQWLPPPTQQVHQTPETARLLQQPGSNARELFAKWQEGVPLGVLGTLIGGNMPLQTVLGYLADMAAAGYPADMQELADAAQLQQEAAQAVASAIYSHGTQGIHAVRQALQQQLGDVGPGQIKIVAALMTTQTIWFNNAGEAPPGPPAATPTAAAMTGEPAAVADSSRNTMQEHLKPGGAPAAAVVEICRAEADSSSQQELLVVADVLADTSNLHQHTAAAGAACVAVAQGQLSAPAAAAGAEGVSPCAAGAAAAGAGAAVFAAPAPKRVRGGGALLSNKTGKRRRPTSIAAPAPSQHGAQQGNAAEPANGKATTPGGAAMASAAVAAGVSPLPVTPSPAGVEHAVPTAQAAGTPAAAAATTPAMATPAGVGMITREAVLQLLWSGTYTAPQLLQKLGASRPEQAQQLQRVLEALVEDGDQVCTTPQGGKIDVHNSCMRFIAF